MNICKQKNVLTGTRAASGWLVFLIAAFVCAVVLAGAALQPQAAWADDPALAPGTVPNDEPAVSEPEAPEEAHADGWEKDGKVWHYWLNGEQVKGNWVVTATAPTGIKGAKKGEHRYWIDCKGNLAVSRLVNPKKAQDASKKAYYAYATKSGAIATGKTKVGNRVYLAKPNGKLESGNVKVKGKTTSILKTKRYDKGETRYYYINPKTHSAVRQMKAVKVSGFGWVLPCYKDAHLATGRKVIGDKIYLARSNGKLETGNRLGLLSSRNYSTKHTLLRYYINPKTHAITYGKPVKVKGFGYVYAPNKGGYLLCGVTRVDSTHVVLADKKGRICNKKGWVWTSKYAGSRERYYLEPTTKNKNVLGARIGHFSVGGKDYYAYKKGYLQRNSYHLWNDTTPGWFYALDDGSLQWEDTVTHLYQEAQHYESPTEYLIMVDIDNPKVMVFEGSQWNWKVKFIWDACTGAPETPTCEGTYSVGIKGWSFGEGNGFSCYYYTQINGDYLFHTRLYYANTWDLMGEDDLGNRHSHGCVHLLDENAKWIWDNVPSGTTIGCIY